MAKKVKKAKSANEIKTELKTMHHVREIEQEILYKDLKAISTKIDAALMRIAEMRDSENFAEAMFKAGRAFDPLNEASDKLDDMVTDLYVNNDFDDDDDDDN